jgi:hypothetical protein
MALGPWKFGRLVSDSIVWKAMARYEAQITLGRFCFELHLDKALILALLSMWC